MSRALNKYKNFLSKANAALTAEYKKTSLFSVASGRTSDVKINVTFSGGLLEDIYYSFYLEVPWKFKAVEDDGLIYIGHDLDVQGRLIESRMAYESFMRDIASRFMYKWGRDVDSSLSNTLFQEVMRNDSSVTSKESIQRDPSLMLKSETYNKMYDEFQKIMSSIKVNLSLRESKDIYPRLSDRSIFPYLVFDPSDDGKIVYITGVWSTNTRQNRQSAYYSYAINNVKYICSQAIQFAPYSNFLDVSISNPGVKRYLLLRNGA